MKPLIIGIAGGTGSGKTTLVDRLLAQFGDDISVLPHDNYYAAHHDLSLEQRQTLNYDHPASFDTDRMIQDLQDLRAGKTIHCPRLRLRHPRPNRGDPGAQTQQSHFGGGHSHL